MNSTTDDLSSTWNDQIFLKNKRRNSIQVVKEANGLEKTQKILPNLSTKKISQTHPILQTSIRRRMNINIKRNKEYQSKKHLQNNIEKNFFFDINSSITTSKNQEILDNYINEYTKTYESQKDILGK